MNQLYSTTKPLYGEVYTISDLLGARSESKSIDSVPSQPVARPEIVAEGMSQVVIVSDGLEHRHDPLHPAVHKGAGTGDHVGSASMAVVPLLLVAAVEGIVQVQEVELSDRCLEVLSPFSAHLGRGVTAEVGAEETDGLAGGGNEGHPAVGVNNYLSAIFTIEGAMS